MSSLQITERTIYALKKKKHSFIVVNYANPDMLGHTGDYAATISSMESLDKCLGKLLEFTNKNGGTLIITADHGNAERMMTQSKQPHTAHTTNIVPFIIIESEKCKIQGHGGNIELRENGSIADIAPTILQILKICPPKDIKGNSLIKSPAHQII